jgi:sugar phosphate isomerase/epimerase
MVSKPKRSTAFDGGERAARPASPRFSLAHLTLLAQTPPELTEIASRAGYDFVSFRAIPLGLPGERIYALGADPVLFRLTRAALKATGMRVLDIELARIYEGVDVRSYLPAMEAGAQLGARHLLTSAWCSDRAFVLERFIELCELAKPLGLTVDFEFVTFTSYRTQADAADLIRASRCENAGICIDTLHFDRSDCSVADLARLPRSWFHYAQICDGPANYAVDEKSLKQVAREARLYLGEGGIDVPAILASAPAMPYSIELPNSARLKELGPTEFARRCLVTARECLAGGAWESAAA